MKHPDWTKPSLTYGETCGPAMDAQTPEEARDYLKALVGWMMRFHGQSEAEAQRVALANIGYWTGYCDGETAKRVLRLFDTSHPIFGRIKPTPEQAIQAGKDLAKETQP